MLKRAFNRTIHCKLVSFFITGSFGSSVAFFLFGKNLWNLDEIRSVLLALGVLAILYIVRFVYFLFIEVIVFIHNAYVDSIWGDAIIDLKNAYAQIHFLRKKDKISDEEFMSTLVSFCNILKVIFDRKTKGNCCVSIKVPAGQFDSIETWNLANLCRDDKHQDRDTTRYCNTKHTVLGNTPYTIIVDNLLSNNPKMPAYYINNDIENTRDYRNTSRNLHSENLKYYSELVHAIIPILGDHEYQHELLGFLCVDCDKKNAFDVSRYDVPMVEGIVDGIYDIILMRTKPQNTANPDERKD